MIMIQVRVNCAVMCCACNIFGQLCFGISGFTRRKKQLACETQYILLSIFVTMEKVIVDVADFTHVQTLTKISICYNIKQDF
jgi:hypothetical protein